MKSLTIWQPSASLIVIGAKLLEIRNRDYRRLTWAPAAGERIVIHAATRAVRRHEVQDLFASIKDDPAIDEAKARPFLERLWLSPGCQGVVFGAGLGTAQLGEVVPLPGSRQFAWPMLAARQWAQPVPAIGNQGFWNWPYAVEMMTEESARQGAARRG
jgi:hypothetical protein